MNQQIHPDREEGCQASTLSCVDQRECLRNAIPQSLLFQRYGKEETPLSLFQQHRWDIEEEFEALIEQGLDDNDGLYILSDAK